MFPLLSSGRNNTTNDSSYQFLIFNIEALSSRYLSEQMLFCMGIYPPPIIFDSFLKATAIYVSCPILFYVMTINNGENLYSEVFQQDKAKHPHVFAENTLVFFLNCMYNTIIVITIFGIKILERKAVSCRFL
jgi:hypothetical protein